MPESGRTQLQMMLMQQAGAGALPLSILPPASFIPFIRTAEQLYIDESLSPIVVYWSRHSAAHLLPLGPRYRQLMKDAFCVSIFSEERTEPPEEWCVLIESRSLSLIVFGSQAIEVADSEKYQCTGSLDPQIVRDAFNMLLPLWQSIDLTESNKLEDARVNVGYCNSDAETVQRLRSQWPVIKSPIQPGLILPGSGLVVSEKGKIAPIGMDSPRQPDGRHSRPAQTPATQPPINPAVASLGAGMAPVQQNLADIRLSDGLDFSPRAPVSEPSTETPRRTGNFPARGDGVAIGAGIPPASGIVPVPGPDRHGNETPAAAQAMITDIVGRLRQSGDLRSILQFAIENLTRVVQAERGLIWQIVGDQLAVTNEFAANGHTCFTENQLNSQESTAIVLDFLTHYPEESGAGVISISDTSQDTNLHKNSATLSSLIELGGVKARLMVQLVSKGIFSGFLELQQCRSIRNWSRQDAQILQSVGEMLSVVVQQSFDQSKIEMDAREMKLINVIASLFRESRGKTSQESLVKSVMLVAEHMGFIHSQIYLYSQEEALLVPQIQNGENPPVPLSAKENPFVAAFESGRGKEINAVYSRKGDSFFGHDMALVLPLLSEGERLGVVGLWQRPTNKSAFRPGDRDLGLTIAGHLSNVIRADQAISQIRADQARAALINKVSSEIRQSLKEVDQITETLVESLQDHFDLALGVVSLYDPKTQNFTKSKTASHKNLKIEHAGNGNSANGQDSEHPPNFGERLLHIMKDELQQGKTIFLTGNEMKAVWAQEGVELDPYFKSTTLVPLIHAGNFKAALCMVHYNQDRPLPRNDMMMVADLADRVAVVVSHAELFAQVERQAVTDPMTGLYNRRYFQEQLSKEIDRFQRFGHAFSLFIVDLDFLKKINDSLGHNSGDIAIKHIANVIKRNVRDVDTVGRFGGEEFVVLLPETDVQHARMVSERICAAIREKPITDIGTITASLGSATYPSDAQDRDKLFELADQALFLAKRMGRNQVRSVSDDLIPSLNENGASVIPISALPAPPRVEEPTKFEVVSKNLDLKMIADEGLFGMLSQVNRAIEERELYDPERSKRASDYATKLAAALHLSKEHAELVSHAAVYSNLGKLDVPAEVLRKSGPLSKDELEVVKRGPATAARLLAPAKTMHQMAPILEAYQERWDGTGFPRGLTGDDIPMEARVVAVVDAFVAMTADLPYRKCLSKQDAMQALKDGAGKEYDPRLVKLFLSLLKKESAKEKAQPN